MPGEGVDVGGEVVLGAGQDQQVLDDVSEAFTTDLMKDQLPEGSQAHDYARVTSPPLEVLGKADENHRKLDDWTNDFVDRTNAGIIIGGLVTTDSAGQIGLRPAVYVRAAQVADVPELAGWYLSGQVRLDQDWSSDTGRRHVIAELTRRTQGLAGFTHARDLWRNGKVADARRALDKLLPSGAGGAVREDGAEFVTTDLVRLFHGHSLEQGRWGAHRPNGSRTSKQLAPTTRPSTRTAGSDCAHASAWPVFSTGWQSARRRAVNQGRWIPRR
ncbi:hypothetical protein PV721_27990 [Streptomyces sp. MB09-01]|uniref:hypothetical protein n=1 Tax=Streptomyces sp. MB09-01 TaxID=3028666 RepID=UPI0029B74E32|nr:hypothetical protein [Streptomyces sp. MB09-01]MDX3538126.1 hypothetical protein [Streptomyces sp. MB09-01]